MIRFGEEVCTNLDAALRANGSKRMESVASPREQSTGVAVAAGLMTSAAKAASQNAAPTAALKRCATQIRLQCESALAIPASDPEIPHATPSG